MFFLDFVRQFNDSMSLFSIVFNKDTQHSPAGPASTQQLEHVLASWTKVIALMGESFPDSNCTLRIIIQELTHPPAVPGKRV